MQSKVNFGLIGCGYWGPNFIRIIQNSRSAKLSRVCDTDAGRLSQFAERNERVLFSENIEDIINDDKIEAVIVCTPVQSHFEITKKLLLAGKHVLCEKPLANTSAHCEELDRIANRAGKKLMVGHVFEYNAVVLHMKKLIAAHDIGDVLYMQFARMGLGPIRKDVNVVFDLASHDVSIAASLMGAQPISVIANGACFVQPGIEDVAFIQLEFANQVFANINVSWIDPIKQRIVKVVGSKKMLLFDDVSTTEKLKIIEAGKDYQVSSGDFGSFQLSTKDGEVIIPNLLHPEPLIEEFNHFVNCIKNKDMVPVTNAKHATSVVTTLEAIQSSIHNKGAKIAI